MRSSAFSNLSFSSRWRLRWARLICWDCIDSKRDSLPMATSGATGFDSGSSSARDTSISAIRFSTFRRIDTSCSGVMMKNESTLSSNAMYRQLVNPSDQECEIALELISKLKNSDLESVKELNSKRSLRLTRRMN